MKTTILNMKASLTLALMLFATTSCKDKEIGGVINEVFMKSYIPFYVDNSLKVYPYGGETYDGKYELLFCRIHGESDMLDGRGTIYWAPELGSTGAEAERFLEIAERNGDRNYNRYENINHWSNRGACADNFKSMQVRCLNTAWDEKHPAGSSLNDLVTIYYYSSADYIKLGYPENYKGSMHWKSLSELKETDLSVIGTAIKLYFDALPAAGSYEMEVTLVTTEDVEKKATCTLVVE